MEAVPDGGIRFQPEELYSTVARLNDAIHRLGPVLLRTRPDPAFRVDALPDRIVVSVLREENEQRYVVCVNTDVDREQTAVVSAQECGDGTVLRDLLDGTSYRFTARTARALAEFPLRAGQGRVLAVDPAP